MNKELEKKLAERYPWIKNNNTLNAYDMICACGNGWYEHIWNLLGEIEEYYKLNNKDVSDVNIFHIKQKFGQLRVYAKFELENAYEIVDRYEKSSTNICEMCGQPGRLYTDKGCAMTLCKDCAEVTGYIY